MEVMRSGHTLCMFIKQAHQALLMDVCWTLKKEEYKIAPGFWARMEWPLTELRNNSVRDVGSIPGLGRSPGGGHDNPLQYSCLENPMDSECSGYSLQGCTELDMTEATQPACTPSVVNCSLLKWKQIHMPPFSLLCFNTRSCLVAKSCPALLRSHGLQTTRLFCSWDFPGKNTGVIATFFSWGSFRPRD